jgi:hypothetical protein
MFRIAAPGVVVVAANSNLFFGSAAMDVATASRRGDPITFSRQLDGDTPDLAEWCWAPMPEATGDHPA